VAGHPQLESQSVRPSEKERSPQIEEEEIQEEETVRARFRKLENEPTQEEIDEHNIDHANFRSWCPHCVKGKSTSFPHLREKEIKEKQVPKVSIDYAYMNDDKKQERGRRHRDANYNYER